MNVFSARRAHLLQSCPGYIYLSGHGLTQKVGDMAHDFAQESSFLYLTGINEPGWGVLFHPSRSYLILPVRSKVQRLFEGEIPDEELRVLAGVDEVISLAQARRLLSNKPSDMPLYSLGPDPRSDYYSFSLQAQPMGTWNRLRRKYPTLQDCRPEISAMRAIKSPAEIALLREAIATTCRAFEDAYVQKENYHFEYEIEADMTRAFRRAGLDGHAYSPIIAAGSHACTLHYSRNQGALQPGELLLLDVGAAKNRYAADITRTYAIGSVSPRHRAVHAAVVEAQRRCIEVISPGVSFAEYQEKTDAIMKEALASVNLLAADSDYRRYFPHAISHGIGLDVHESLGGFKEFQPGMVLTVEPGIYIPEEGIGVRIEDMVLVTADGRENLSAALSVEL